MKKTVFFLGVLSFVFFSFPLSAAADTIYIDNMAELQMIGNDPGYPLSGVTYVLTSDIDATGVDDFVPIGTTYYTGFSGVFDGQGHSIRNLRIIRPSSSFVGLFDKITASAGLYNICLDNVTMQGDSYVGGLVGYADCIAGNSYSTIQNCAVTGRISGQDQVGGLVGENQGYVYKCFSNARVNGASNVGGLIGSNGNYTGIDDCFSTGDVSGENIVGGFIGYQYYFPLAYTGLFYNYSAGRVYGASEAGGFIGHNDDSSGKIVNCYWNTSANPGLPGAGYGSTNGITGLDASAMKHKSSFGGFNFDYGTWCITENVTYPQLQWASSSIVPQDDTYTASQYGTLRANFLNNDRLPAGVFNVTNTSMGTLQVSDNGSFAYIPREYFRGEDSFTYQTGGCSPITATVHITVHDCTYELQADSASIPAEGGSGTITITPSGERCPWEIDQQFTPSWITFDGSSGTGPGTIGYTVAPNRGPERTGTIVINWQQYTVFTQQSGCTYSIYPGSVTAPNAGVNRSVTIQASDSECPWTAASDNASWLTIYGMPEYSGQGSNSFYLYIAENTGSGRSAHITAAGRTFPVAQRDYTTQIASLADLQKIGTDLPLDGMYSLVADIEGAGAEISPIGSCSEPFTGILAGSGHTISNLQIKKSEDDCVGLFGSISGGAISSLKLTGMDVQGRDKTGIFSGYAEYSEFNYVNTAGAVEGHDRVGGLIGQAEHLSWWYIYGCSSAAAVTGNNWAGGLLGSDNGSTIMYSTSRASVHASGDYAGGFAGALSGSQVHDIYSQGDVSGANYVGGFAGFIDAHAILSVSSSTGTVSGASKVGGFAGVITGLAAVNNCYGAGAVSGTSELGGFVGSADNATIAKTYSAGLISGAAPPQAGGFAGSLSGMQFVSGNYWDNETAPLGAGAGSGDEAGIAGRPTALMHQGATFEGWDFSTTWCIAEDAGYPLLRSHANGISVSNDSYSVSAYDILKVAAPGVLDNDRYPEAPRVATEPSHGTLDLKDNGSFEYQPAPGYAGADSFIYQAGGCSTATVSLTVRACHFALQPAQAQFSKAGGSGSFAITADVEACPWEPRSNAAWVHIISPDNSTGSGTLSYTVDANSGQSREATITLGDAVFTVIQYAPEIGSIADLQKIGSTYPLDGDYELSGEIDATGVDFQPIGDCNHPFTGTFNGSGHKIQHLSINKSSNCVGLFGALLNAAISNVAVDQGSVIGSQKVGGIAGNALHSTISGCSFSGTVSGYAYIGGIAGMSDNSTLNACTSAGTVSTDYRSTGGIAGFNQQHAVIDNCSSTAHVTGPQWGIYIGGIAGENDNATIMNSSSEGVVSAGSNSYYVGGVAGTSSHNAEIIKSHSTGQVTGYIRVGGIVGTNDNATIMLSSAQGNVHGSGTSFSSDLGGIAGENYHATISSCFSTGSVTNFNSYGGGLVGDNNRSFITESFSTGTVTGSYEIGGLVGISQNNATITDSYSTGNAQGITQVGGLIGYNSSATVTNCYSTGLVTYNPGEYSFGGLTGYCSGGITASYWNTETSGQTEGCFGTCPGAYGMTTAQMKQQETFTGWDFSDTWCMIENATYPQLAWHAAQLGADNDSYSVSAYGELTVPAPGVLANDNDSTGFGLAAILVSPPSHGVLRLSDNGSFIYTPAQGYLGIDEFTYSSGGCQAAAVTITVTPCSISIDPEEEDFTASGGDGAIIITASGSGCPWTAAKSDSWITITSGQSGAGNAAIQYTVEANSGAARSGSITVEGTPLTITQDAYVPTTTTTMPAGEDCILAITPDTVAVRLKAQDNSTNDSSSKLFGYAGPLRIFKIEKEDGTTFEQADKPQWNTNTVKTLLSWRPRTNRIKALVFINRRTTEAGDYEITVNDCKGTITIKDR